MIEFQPQHLDESEAIDPFASLAVSEESVLRFLGGKDVYDTSKHVCICGHAMNKHSGFDSGHGSCVTGRHWCPCATPKPVLIAQDTRFFMRKTYGPGSRHALSTGMLRLRQRGVRMAWLEKPVCWRPDCNSGNELIFPVALNDAMRVADAPAKINVFLCESCALAAMGAPGREGYGWIW
jgi:hypothetical protein